MIKRIVRIALLILLFSGFAWTLVFLYRKSQKPPVVYKTLCAIDTAIIQKTVATGSITPRKEVNIKSRVSGIVEKFFVSAGNIVREGDVLARIKIVPNMVNLSQAETRVNQAKVSLDNARAEYERNKNLLEQGVISKADFLPSDLKFKSAEVELKAAEDNLQIIRDGVTKALESASNTLVRATISGMVLDVPIKEGSSVIESNTFNEGTTIAVVANMTDMIFEGKVDESEVGKLSLGMPILLTVAAIENLTLHAKLEYIAPKGLPENGAIQFLIRASLPNHDQQTILRAAYSASAEIILHQKEKTMAIPESVLNFEGERIFVEVKKSDGTFQKTYIKTGISDGIFIEVLSGIEKSNKIKIPDAEATETQKNL